MKKLLSLIAIAAFGLTTAFAQTPATTRQTKKVAKKEVKSTMAPAKTAAKKVEVKTNTTVSKVKADGTPDMRFKDNKTKSVTKVVGPVKKDGTADMRYKSNKTTTTMVKKH